jgi:phenylacetate-CoA ligase
MLVRVGQYYIEALHNLRLSAQEIHELQRRKLRRALRAAYDLIPLYHEWFRAIGKAPEDIRSTADLTLLPTLTKAQVATRFPGGIVARGQRPAVARSSTGTTGAAMTMEISHEQLDVSRALYFRRLTVFGVRPWTRIVSIWKPATKWNARVIKRGRARPDTMANSIPFSNILGIELPTFRSLVSTPEDLTGEARRLARLHPGFVICRPTHLRRLGARLTELGIAVSPDGVQVTQEMLTPTCRREIEQSLNTEVFQSYGSTEFDGAGFECRAHAGVHLAEDFALVEVLRDGQPVGAGEQGELVMTSLHNDVMPLIRYRTQDFVRLAEDDKCRCGSCLIRVSAILGRSDDALLTSSGEKIHGVEVADQLESRFGLRDFQVVQTGTDRLVLKLGEREVGEKGELNDGLKAYFEALLGCRVHLTMETRLQSDLWDKYRPVVSRLPQTQQ